MNIYLNRADFKALKLGIKTQFNLVIKIDNYVSLGDVEPNWEYPHYTGCRWLFPYGEVGDFLLAHEGSWLSRIFSRKRSSPLLLEIIGARFSPLRKISTVDFKVVGEMNYE